VGSTVALLRDPWGFMNTAIEYGDVVSYTAFGRQFVAVGDPDVVERVLVAENDAFEKGGFQQAFGELIAPEGVVFTEGERWRRQRQLLQSAFTPREIQSYADEMVTETAALADTWADGDVIELRETTSALALRILTRTLFDLDFDAERGAIVRDAVRALSDYIGNYATLMLVPSWVPTPSKRRYERAMGELDTLVDELVAERRNAAETPTDLLSMLAAAEYPDGEQMSPGEVRDQLVTFLFAGHETTATALTWALSELGRKPAVAERLRREVDDVVDGGYATLSELPELTYTEQVLRETLRRYPPAAAVFREADEDVEVGGYRLPEDMFVVLPQFRVHTDERWWSDPMAFAPSRWAGIEDPPGDRPEYSYFPFGGGPRHCIGMRFARMELRLALATIAKRCRIETLSEAIDVEVGSTVHPGGEVRTRVTARE
jgi:cytochrome P450